MPIACKFWLSYCFPGRQRVKTLPTCFHLQDGKSHDDSESLRCFEKTVVLCWFLHMKWIWNPETRFWPPAKILAKSCNCFSWSWPSRIVGTSGTHHTSTHFPKCQPSGQRAKGTKPIASDSPVSCCMVSLPHPFSTMKLRAGWLCTNANFGFLTFTSSPEMTERHSFHTDPSNTNGWLWYRVSTQFQRLNSTKVAEANSKRLHFKIF